MRAVTFQSMLRTSSPCWYSRTSENSIPCPLNTERYSPEKSELTSPRVRSSRSLTWRRMSGGTPVLAGEGMSVAADGPSACVRPRHDAVRITLLRRCDISPHSPRPTPHVSWAFYLRQNLLHDVV